MERETIFGVGLILLVSGVIMFFVLNPSYTSLCNRRYGYETPTLKKSEFEQLNLLNTTVMPILNVFIAIGLTLMLFGVVMRRETK